MDSNPSTARVETNGESSSSSAAEDKALFESAMDKTFQRFADRLAQNPEQVLRYEFGGQPLLYSKSDAVGKLLAPAVDAKIQTSSARNGTSTSQLKMPRCVNCGADRVFELQLTPHAITELEADDVAIDGMEWGTVIVGVCSADCQTKGKVEGEVGYIEEWAGVQWEEVADHTPR
jgi:pre-rRNA-processing protein TSR4